MKTNRVFSIVAMLALCLASTPYQAQVQRRSTQSNESTSGGVRFPDCTLQTTAGIAPANVVKSLNGLKGDVTLAAGSNITITPAGNTLTVGIASPLEVQDVSKTSVLVEQFITSEDVDPANNPVLGPIDTSGARSTRILVRISFCSPCSNVNVEVRSDSDMTIDAFSVAPGTGIGVTRVYEIPGTQLKVRVGNSAPSTSNVVKIIILGRSN